MPTRGRRAPHLHERLGVTEPRDNAVGRDGDADIAAAQRAGVVPAPHRHNDADGVLGLRVPVHQPPPVVATGVHEGLGARRAVGGRGRGRWAVRSGGGGGRRRPPRRPAAHAALR